MAGNHPSPPQLFSDYILMISLTLLLLHFQLSQSQQSYVNNKQLDCDQNYTTTLGYTCSAKNTTTTSPSSSSPSSCTSYLTFRSLPPYNTPSTISTLLNSSSSSIAKLNNIPTTSTPIPTNTLLLIPINCSCSSPYYQHTTSYVIHTPGETYFSMANNTFQSLSTCQALIEQNPYNFRNLYEGMKVRVPLRCACPSKNQTNYGFKYLLTYLIKKGDTINDIALLFASSGADNESILYGNELQAEPMIYFFTPLLVPLKSEPTELDLSVIPLPPSPPPVDDSRDQSSMKWVFIGVGVGGGLLVLGFVFGCLVLFLRRRESKATKANDQLVLPKRYGDDDMPKEVLNNNNQPSTWSVSSEGVRYAIGSLTYYKYEEVQEATGFFGEANRIRGSVYLGSFKGDAAAVKVMRGDVTNEINVLKQLNHSNVIGLSGYCVHQGNTYLVYEYAEHGCVGDFLHGLSFGKKDEVRTNVVLGWSQRVQIAFDVADALNYLHNYSNPPYIHKNLSCTNVVLDGNMRAKVANFGLARKLEANDEDGGVQLTRHVVGTQGCMAPEYIDNGLITPKMDVFAFGVLMLELLSGREAVQHKDSEKGKEDELLYVKIDEVLGGENVREKLKEFIDPCLKDAYPFDLAYSMAQLAGSCVAHDLNSRPNIAEVFLTLSKIQSSSLDWDPSYENDYSRSMSHGR